MKRCQDKSSGLHRVAGFAGAPKSVTLPAMKPKLPANDDYEVRLCAANDLSGADLAACIALVTDGEAVDPASAKRDLPCSNRIAVARKEGKVVGVGVIKPIRPRYAAGVSAKSKIVFRDDTPELGYVAVHPDHRGHRLSPRLVSALLENVGKPLFATTSSDRMKATLVNSGFVQQGKEWKGRRGDQISLWMRQ